MKVVCLFLHLHRTSFSNWKEKKFLYLVCVTRTIKYTKAEQEFASRKATHRNFYLMSAVSFFTRALMEILYSKHVFLFTSFSRCVTVMCSLLSRDLSLVLLTLLTQNGFVTKLLLTGNYSIGGHFVSRQVFWHSSRVLKLFPLFMHPPKVNILHFLVTLS